MQTINYYTDYADNDTDICRKWYIYIIIYMQKMILIYADNNDTCRQLYWYTLHGFRNDAAMCCV